MSTKRAVLRFSEQSPPLPVDAEAEWDTYGIVVEDSEGREHHFGRGDAGNRPFVHIATYNADGTREDVYFADDVEEPIRAGHVVREAQLGPRLSAIVRTALSRLAQRCNLGKGFASPEEKKWAVETFQALHDHGREPYDPDEVYVFAATHGWTPKDAKKLAGFAEGVRNGRRYLAGPYGVIRVDPDRAQQMLEFWRGQS